MSASTRVVPPRAGAMIEALRGLGYSTAAALADIVDNSVSAGATEVRIQFDWDGSASRIAVLDNGRGMDDAALESAMRLGEKNPLDARDAGDLGRFGMGLKTASFSQCRRLTVASIRDGARSCLRWDLDALALDPSGGWLLYEGPAAGSEIHLASLPAERPGTLVLWETLDRVVTGGHAVEDFLRLVEHAHSHLAMTFHRLLEGPSPRLAIRVNGRPIAPWDPFMSDNPAKSWESPLEKRMTEDGLVAVECHVLPHKDKLSEAEFKAGGGPDGWNAQQGFYVYRNERLLVAGGWLGLGQGRAWNREEAYRLARIRLDIPNTADAAWKIDIRKSTARPPVSLRAWLTTHAEDTRERARKVFAFRGSPVRRIGSAPIEQAWRVEHLKAGVRYRIDEKHPAIQAAIEASGQNAPLVRAMLRVIEETVPVQRIWLDTAEHKDTPQLGFAGEPSEEVVSVLSILFEDMVGRRGMSAELAKRALLTMEPFQNFPALVAALGPDDDGPTLP